MNSTQHYWRRFAAIVNRFHFVGLQFARLISRRRGLGVGLDFLPRRCYLCEAVFRGETNVCPRCVAQFMPLPLVCERCAEPLPGGESLKCFACQQHGPDFERVVVGWVWAKPLSDLIKRFKFNGDLLLGRNLATLWSRQIRQELAALTPTPDCIIPVPLHRKRLRQRGFNQAYILAQALSEHTGWPILLAARRVLATPAQSGLTRRERQQNLRAAFAVESSVSGRHALIVDDVMTTGSTAQALAHQLLAAGAKSVQVAVVAKVLK